MTKNLYGPDLKYPYIIIIINAIMSSPSLSDYFNELYPTLDPNTRIARFDCLRAIDNMRLDPIREIYWFLRDVAGIPEDFDDADVYEALWDVAESIHDSDEPKTDKEIIDIAWDNPTCRDAFKTFYSRQTRA